MYVELWQIKNFEFLVGYIRVAEVLSNLLRGIKVRDLTDVSTGASHPGLKIRY